MGDINYFDSVYFPQVKEVKDIYTIMDDIKSPSPEIVETILLARKAKEGGNEKLYDNYKLSLPCFTFNFLFKNVKKNENIKAPTGFIYIDQDDCIDLDINNEYIFATWLSVSGTGRVILVRVEGLSSDNFKATYSQVSELLGVETDKDAAKATQYNIHSYDPELFHNENSLVFKAVSVNTESKEEIIKNEYWENELMNKVQFSSNKLIKDKVTTKANNIPKINHNSIDEYDFEGKDYILFEGQKEYISKLYIPHNKINK